MAATPSSPTLTCSQCGFVNEAERVYCHNCGTKLDRSILPKPEDGAQESLDKTRRRVQKITNPGGLNPVRELRTLANTLLYSVLTALIVQLVRTPENVPSNDSGGMVSRIVSSEIAEALESPTSRVMQFTEQEVNSYFRTSLRSKATGVLPGVKFERAYVRFEDGGSVYIGLQQSVWDYSLYSGARYRIGVKEGKFFATNEGGNFGRIAVHPALMKGLAIAFSPLFGALKREHTQMAKMQQVVVDQGRVVLVTKGGTP